MAKKKKRWPGIREKQVKYYEEHPELLGDPLHARWYREAQEALAKRKRLTREHKQARVAITPEQRRLLFRAYNGWCAYCLTTKADVLDHVIPLAEHGALGAENAVPCCNRCNSRKCDLVGGYWVPSIPWHRASLEEARAKK